MQFDLDTFRERVRRDVTKTNVAMQVDSGSHDRRVSINAQTPI